MIDHIKVIKGLGETLEVLANHVPERYLGYSAGACLDAVELLKQNEPRVLTLEEVKEKNRVPAWFESRDLYHGHKGFWVLLGDMGYHSQVKEMICGAGLSAATFKLSEYGKIWRCWSQMPTNEQRWAVGWND